MKRPGAGPIARNMSAALDSRASRAAELLLVHCALLSAATDGEPRRPVFERLRELLGADLTSLLLFGLTAQRARRAGWSPP